MELLKFLNEIQPDYDTKESYQHGFFDAIKVVKDRLALVDTDRAVGLKNIVSPVKGRTFEEAREKACEMADKEMKPDLTGDGNTVIEYDAPSAYIEGFLACYEWLRQ